MPLNLHELATDRYRPIIHWKWNGDPTPERMREQLERIATAGFGGVCIQPMPDQFRPHDFAHRMKPAYLGPAFFEAYRRAVELAAEFGLLVWIYDEGGWPSGQACGLVLEGHPAFQGHVMIHEAGRFIKAPSGRVDPLNLHATQRFITLTHERYDEAVGDYFGHTIEAVFSDELSVPGMVGTDRIPWTEDLPEQYAQRTGEDLDRVLPWLFEGHAAQAVSRERVLQARHAFTRVWNELFVERCLQPQQAWCREHGVLLTGHFAGDHDLSRHPACFGDYFDATRCFDVPGIDTIWRQIWPDHRADFALLAGSARTVSQRDWAMSETGAVYGLDLAPADLKWVADQQIMRGINRITLMSMPLADDVNEGLKPYSATNPTWEALTEWNQHTALLAALTSAGRPGVRRAVLYPTDDLWARGPDAPGTLAQTIVGHLLRRPAGCIYVDHRTLTEGKIDDGAIWCGDARIEQVYIAGNALLAAATLNALQRLVNAGIRVIVVGSRPLQPMNDRSDKSHQQIHFDELSMDGLPEVDQRFPLPAEFELDCSGDDFIVQHRVGPDWQTLILSNEASHPAHVRYRLPSHGVSWEIDSEARVLSPWHSTLDLNVDPGRIIAVAWGNVAGLMSSADGPTAGSEMRHDPVRGPWMLQADWQVTCESDRWERKMVDMAQRATELGPWKPKLGGGFSGQATYTTTFAVDHPRRWQYLDLGQVKYVAEVWLNGCHLGRRAWAPYCFLMTEHLRLGLNELRIAVCNTPANAYWEPCHLARIKAAGRWNIYGQRILERCPPTLDGGLYGPVTLTTSPIHRIVMSDYLAHSAHNLGGSG